jgi:hypothetical protein
MTHFTGPISYNENETNKKQVLAGYPLGDPTLKAEYFNDFVASQDYAAADWVITTTEAGAGSASEALSASEIGGALVITNDSADADLDQLQASSDGGTTVAEIWDLSSPKKLWFSTRFKVSDATDSAAIVGLCITDTSLVAGMSDGLYFRKADADATLQAVAEKDSTESTVDIVEMADDTYVEVGMLYQSGDRTAVEVFYRNVATEGTDVSKETAAKSKKQWSKVGELTSNLPDNEALAVSLAITNGAAAAKVLTVDYLHVAQERN